MQFGAFQEAYPSLTSHHVDHINPSENSVMIIVEGRMQSSLTAKFSHIICGEQNPVGAFQELNLTTGL